MLPLLISVLRKNTDADASRAVSDLTQELVKLVKRRKRRTEEKEKEEAEARRRC